MTGAGPNCGVLVGVSGSVGASRRTTALVRELLEATATLVPELEIDLIDLSDEPLPLCDGRQVADLPADARAVIERVGRADALVLGTPVYRASFSAVLKNLLDTAPGDLLLGMPVAIAVSGGSRDHSLVGDYALRPVLAAMGARTLPAAVYAEPEAMDDGKARPPLRQQIEAVAAELGEALRDKKREPGSGQGGVR